MARLHVVAALFLMGASCSQLDAEPPSVSLADSVRAAQQHMHARFAALERLQLSIVYGQLDQARAEAHRVATIDDPAVLARWRPYLDDVRASAQRIEHASDITAAARLLPLLGQSCGRCHTAAGAHIAFPAPPPPPVPHRLAPEMASHRWATQQMWEGLIGPSDDRWRAGAAALARAPLTIVAEGGTPGLGIADDVARVRLFARRAATVHTASDRAALYGDLLATCVHCHAIIRDR